MHISKLTLGGLLAAAVVLAGCPRKPGKADAGAIAVDAGPADAGAPDAGEASDAGQDAGPPPPCQYDDDCGTGLRCDAPTGQCVAATACNPQFPESCASDSQSDYCYKVGGRCRCDVDPNAPDAGGFCKRVRQLCSPCASDEQCNPCPDSPSDCDPMRFVYPSYCRPVGDAGTYCLRSASAPSCPCGYVADPATHVCQPQSGSCSGEACCQSDTECVTLLGPGHVCDTSSGVCKEVCGFDYNGGTSTNCPPGEVCDVLPQFVLPDAGIVLYGVGRCGKPCDQAGGTQCDALGASAGLSYQCFAEKGGEHRCRPVNPDGGHCMNDLECPRTSDGGPYAGYCSLYAFACAYDCRDGIDPIKGVPYADNDCAPPAGSATSYACVNHACVEKNCVEKGGAQYGFADQLCCGEDRDHTGAGDAGIADLTHPMNACAPGVDAGEFFFAPSPPWCSPPCVADSLQNAIDSCGPDAGLPSFDSSPNVCVQYDQGVFACALAAPYGSVCPKNWTFGSPYDVQCSTDADCQSDGGSGGHCQITTYPDGGLKEAYCSCSQDERLDAGAGLPMPYFWGGQCPDGTRCFQRRKCAFTVACIPGAVACRYAPDGG